MTPRYPAGKVAGQMPPPVQPVILGVINVSPESPNRSSVATTPADAVRLARRHVRNGAAIIDIGGRSSSHDAPIISDAEEQRRILPVAQALKSNGFLVSIDTWSSETAFLAVAEGVDVVNFTGEHPSALLCEAIAAAGATLCLSYMPHGDPYAMRKVPGRLPSIEEIVRYFETHIPQPRPSPLIIDPNIGMLHADIRPNRPLAIAWRMRIVARLGALAPLGAPVMLALPRRDGPGATRMWTVAILTSGARYIRTHHPAIVTSTAALLAELAGNP